MNLLELPEGPRYECAFLPILERSAATRRLDSGFTGSRERAIRRL